MKIKEFYSKNKAISIACILYFILMIADLISTKFLGELYPYLEANILFPFIGLIGIFLLNILIIWAIIHFYTKSKDPYIRFIIMLAVIGFSMVRILILINNIQIGMAPPSLEEAMAKTAAEKIETIKHFTLLSLLPFVVGVITFILYKIDHKISVKK